jgi:hypothetical protein
MRDFTRLGLRNAIGIPERELLHSLMQGGTAFFLDSVPATFSFV